MQIHFPAAIHRKAARAGDSNGSTCWSWGRFSSGNQACGDKGPGVGLVGAQGWVAHNVDCVCCHQVVVLVSVPLPAHTHRQITPCLVTAA